MEEKEEGPIMMGEVDKQLDERVAAPTSIYVTDEQISMGPTSLNGLDNQNSKETAPAMILYEEELKEQDKELEQAQEEPRTNSTNSN